MKEVKKDIIDSRCGLHCTGCAYQENFNCGECSEVPCELLTQYSCDPEHGDSPCGARIEQCRKWHEEYCKLDVYEVCPMFENTRYRIRRLKQEDTVDLLNVYSDEKAVPVFNSDNCHGNDFRYVTEERMRQAVDYWLWEYGRRGFVRWSIVDKHAGGVIGTIELFRRNAKDASDGCGILRLDLRSDYEMEEEIFVVLGLILPSAYILFDCERILTKAIPAATERRCALERLGFVPSEMKLVGHDGTEYGNYFVK